MQKLAKRLSVFMVAMMTLSMMLNFVMVAPAKAATIYPQVQYAQEPQLEYTVGDRVQFNLYTPNYGGRVQYRVVLWNDETKSYKDLWTNTPDRYYDKWMPYGNNIFTLGWVINEPGHYRITIYAKRAGVPNNETYLKGFNCDSYMESDSFVVKAKEVVKVPDVPADTLKLETKSAQMVVGQEYTVKANVGKAGVRVLFDIDAPASSMNKDMTGEALSDASGVATYKYTRTYGDADFISAYPAASPAVRDVAKVYWGVTPILSIEAMDKDDAVSITNGAAKQYKVKLRNPMTGEPMRYKEVKVMLKENIDTLELRSTAVVTNDFNGVRLTPYQREYNIVTGGLNQNTLSLVTNDNGEATFTLTGYNTKATPIVYYDSYEFFNQLPIVQLGDYYWYDDEPENGATLQYDYRTNSWAWSFQLPAPIGMPDTSQVAATFSGDYDCRLDATELQAEAKTVSFVLVGYTFTSTMNGEKFVAVSNYQTGRKYTVTVNKPDGKPYAGGLLNVRIEQLFDAVSLSNHTDARIIGEFEDFHMVDYVDGHDRYTAVQIELNAKGQASFTIASPTLNDIATPRVWIDQDVPGHVNVGSFSRNFVYQDGEPTKLLDSIYFVNRAVNNSAFSADLTEEDLVANVDAEENLINIAGQETVFTLKLRDQNNTDYIPAGSRALVTYTVTNTGGKPVVIYNPDELTDIKVDGYPMVGSVTLEPNETVTISGNGYINENGFELYILAEKATAVTVSAHAVTSRSNDNSAWQPSNTYGAVVLAKATLSASWVNVTDLVGAEKIGTVEFYNTSLNYIVVKSGSTYYKMSYDETTHLMTVYDQLLSEEEFEDGLDIGIKVYIFKGANGNSIRFLN